MHKQATIFGGFISADIFVMRLLQLPHQAYNSIPRKNRRSWCQGDRKHINICDRSKRPICEQSVKTCNNSTLVVRYVTKLVQN